MSPRPDSLGAVLPRGLLILVGTAAATITIAGMRGISGIIAPAFLALVLTIAVHPIRGWLRQHKVPNWAATIVMILVVYAILITLAVALVIATAKFATLLPTYKDEMASTVKDATSWLSNFGVGPDQIEKIEQSFDLSSLGGVVGNLLGSFVGVLSNLFFIVTLLLFLAVDGARFPDLLADLPTERSSIVVALRSFAQGTRSYLVVSTVFGLIVAVLDTGVLALMGIPSPLLWGLLAFITNYIPNIGFIIGLIPPAILGLLEGGPGLMIAVILVYSGINVVIQSVIQPKVVGDAVGLSTTLTFLSLVFWGWVMGPLGALLAIPLSLLAKALLVDVDPSSRWLRPLLGSPEPKEPPAEPDPPPEDLPAVAGQPD